MEAKKPYNINYKQRCISRINKGQKVLLSTIKDHNITVQDVDVSNVVLHRETRNNIIFNSKSQNLLNDADSSTKVTMLESEIATLKASVEALQQQHVAKQTKLLAKYNELHTNYKLVKQQNQELVTQLESLKVHVDESEDVHAETIPDEPVFNPFKKKSNSRVVID